MVYDKHETNVGFVDVGDFNNQIAELEKERSSDVFGPRESIATHVLILMVRGIFTKLELPYTLSNQGSNWRTNVFSRLGSDGVS